MSAEAIESVVEGREAEPVELQLIWEAAYRWHRLMRIIKPHPGLLGFHELALLGLRDLELGHHFMRHEAKEKALQFYRLSGETWARAFRRLRIVRGTELFAELQLGEEVLRLAQG